MASVTIRDVPDEVRDELAGRAARAGQSLQEHLRAALIELAARPSPHDLMVEVSAVKRELGSHLAADSILAHRDTDRR
ncbi:MAG: hypothetical protein ACFCVK_14585 [Acidimicrobiales bacterium]